MSLRCIVLSSALIFGLSAGAAAETAELAKIQPRLKPPEATTECPSGPGDPTEGRALRPQPEPPGKEGTIKPLSPGATKGFNPQPEPPAQRGTKKRMLTPGETRGLRPQPEPPGKEGTIKPLSPGALRGFNPQPEPPEGKVPGESASPC